MSTRDTPPTLDALLSETDWIRALAHRLIVDPGTADDVAQDATVVALTRPPTSADAVRGWLRRVVKNLASNARRGETRRGAREAAVASHAAEVAADEVVARWEIRRQVVAAVLALDEPYRTTILLHFFDGLTTAECAARLKVPLETARTRTRRALELLRGRLAHLDDGRGRKGSSVLLSIPRSESPFEGTAVHGPSGAAGGMLMACATNWIGATAALLLLGLGMTWAVSSARDSAARPTVAASEHGSDASARAPRPRHPVDVANSRSPADIPATAEHVEAPKAVEPDLPTESRPPKPRIPIRTRVTDEFGNPLAGIELSISYVGSGQTPSSTTAADGALTFTADCEPAQVWVNLSRQQSRTLLPTSVLLRPGQRDVAVVVRRGKTIRGRVVDEADRPVWEGTVSAYDGAARVGSGATNRDGEFAFAVPTGHALDLTASQWEESGKRSRAVGELGGVDPDADDIVVRVVREPAPRALDVEVVDDSGAPVADARVTADSAEGDPSRWVYGATAPDGRVTLSGLPRRSVMITVTVFDRGKGANRYWSPLPRRVPGAVDSVRVVVGPPRTLHGRVAFEDGAPCAGAVVTASAGLTSLCMTVAETDGRFELNVPADRPAPFGVYASEFFDGLRNPRQGYDVVDAEDRELSVVIHPVPNR